MSCYRALNPGPLPYQGSALPLSYNSKKRERKTGLKPATLSLEGSCSINWATSAFLPKLSLWLWAKMDSNHRRRKPADLQSAPFGHSGICPFQNQEIKELFSNNMIKTDVLSLFFGFFLSLLSDSNQRPRDYKSRALANWAKEANLLKMQPSRSNASETAANLVIYFFPAKYLGFFYLLRCFSLYLTSCFPSASTSKSIASSNVSHTLLA